MSNEVRPEHVLYAEELERENIMYEQGVNRYNAQRYSETTTEADLPPGVYLMKQIIPPTVKAIQAWIDEYRGKRGAHAQSRNAKLLEEIDAESLAFMTCRVCFESISTSQNQIANIGSKIGKHVENTLNMFRLKAAKPKLFAVVDKDNKKRYQSHRSRMKVLRNVMEKQEIDQIKWSQADKFRVGRMLIEFLVQETSLFRIFSGGTNKKNKKYRDASVLLPTKALMNYLDKQHAHFEGMSPVFTPMIIKPVDWIDPFIGGYLKHEFPMIKTHHPDYLESISDFKMPIVYKTINTLQKTPWRINKKIYKLMNEAWVSGGGLELGLPTTEREELPPLPKDIDTNEEAKKSWKMRAAKIHTKNFKAISKRVALIQKLGIAKDYLAEPEIFFVYQYDWRGRIYPVPILMNPQGDDTGKALIHFARGKPLGSESGVKWLKIQLANTYGEDKISFEDRCKWVEDNEHKILESAQNPLDGSRWWTDADKPWCFLAACLEYQGYKEQGLNYVSHLPIAQDGSNNGLQHWSALLKDKIGGKATNLLPADKPADIYTDVLLLCHEQIRRDANAGDEIAQMWIDRGMPTRKHVKRPVMTLAYGASRFGMQDQILSEMDKEDAKASKEMRYFGAKNSQYAKYLSLVVHRKIKEVVVAAVEGMEWLQGLARIMGKANLPMYWESPCGFPVLQDIKKIDWMQVQTSIGGGRIGGLVNVIKDEIDEAGQVRGISPNYVHSVDSSHLSLTINKLAGRTYKLKDFACIHDSYGVHACDSDLLAKFLRKEFVEMHSKNLLAELLSQLKARAYEGGVDLPDELPPKGNLNLKKVQKSTYFFG